MNNLHVSPPLLLSKIFEQNTEGGEDLVLEIRYSADGLLTELIRYNNHPQGLCFVFNYSSGVIQSVDIQELITHKPVGKIDRFELTGNRVTRFVYQDLQDAFHIINDLYYAGEKLVQTKQAHYCNNKPGNITICTYHYSDDGALLSYSVSETAEPEFYIKSTHYDGFDGCKNPLYMLPEWLFNPTAHYPLSITNMVSNKSGNVLGQTIIENMQGNINEHKIVHEYAYNEQGYPVKNIYHCYLNNQHRLTYFERYEYL